LRKPMIRPELPDAMAPQRSGPGLPNPSCPNPRLTDLMRFGSLRETKKFGGIRHIHCRGAPTRRRWNSQGRGVVAQTYP
jgi:hypothetical protein